MSGSAGTAVPVLSAGEKRFVFDTISAGPIRLSQVAAKLDKYGCLRFTGELTHSGGDSGQLLGGRAVIRVEMLAAPASSPATAAAPVVLHLTQESWVNRGERKRITIVSPTTVGGDDFDDVGRIQVYLQHYPNR